MLDLTRIKAIEVSLAELEDVWNRPWLYEDILLDGFELLSYLYDEMEFLTEFAADIMLPDNVKYWKRLDEERRGICFDDDSDIPF